MKMKQQITKRMYRQRRSSSTDHLLAAAGKLVGAVLAVGTASLFLSWLPDLKRYLGIKRIAGPDHATPATEPEVSTPPALSHGPTQGPRRAHT
jgi:hypothetical protein